MSKWEYSVFKFPPTLWQETLIKLSGHTEKENTEKGGGTCWKEKGFNGRGQLWEGRETVCVWGQRERKKMTEFIVQIYETLNKMLII